MGNRFDFKASGHMASDLNMRTPITTRNAKRLENKKSSKELNQPRSRLRGCATHP